MDPVSIAASSIAFISACRKLAAEPKFLRALSKAPDDVLALTDELNDLQNVLRAIHLVTRKRQDNVFGDLLAPLFAKVDRVIHELCDVCGTCPHQLKNDSEHAEQIKSHLLARFKWTRAKDRVGELRDRLKSIRLDFANSLATVSLLDVSQISSNLTSLSIELLDRTPSEAPRGDPPQYEEIPRRIPTVLQSNDGVTDINNSNMIDKQIHTSNFSSKTCRRSCSCKCDGVYRVKTPEILQNVVGSLLINSNGVYGTYQPCNEFSCRRRTSASVRISYRFPEWLLNRMVSSVIMSNSISGPQVSLCTPRIVPNESDVFFYSIEGNIGGLAKLFQAGLASPLDIARQFGYTPLHYAVDRGHIDLCRFLLKAGAKPAITDAEDNSVTDLAWNKICSKSIPTSYATELEEVFSKDVWFEERQFTILHKIVLDLLSTPRTLESELSATTSNIETPDSEGRTPLSWAAEQGNASAVSTLLSYGASTTSTSQTGMTPLHYAAKAPTPHALTLLLAAGASVHARNKWQQTPLNLASYFQTSASSISTLLDHGADIHDRDCYGSTALNLALFMNRVATVQCLVARGANISDPALQSFTPVNDSIEHNSHECLSVLLESGANLAASNVDGETALHTAARRGDLRTMQILSQAVGMVEGLDAEARTREGCTAWDLMRARGDAGEEVERAFRTLMATVEPRGGCVAFFDAVEELPMPPPLNLKGEGKVKTAEMVQVRVEEVLAD